jgi:sugar phosphate permease
MAMRKTGSRVRNTFFFLLWLIFFAGYLGRAHFVIVMPLIRADLGLNCTTAGMAMSAIFLGYLLFQFAGTSISLRLGPRKALTLALVWWGLFTALTGVVPALAAMLVVRCLLGVGETLHPASAWICLLNWFPRTEWNRANAIILTSAAFAGVATPLIVTGLLQIAGWQTSFFFSAFLCALLAA